MWNLVKRILQRVSLMKIKDKFIIINGVKVRVVAEPYPPPKLQTLPRPK